MHQVFPTTLTSAHSIKELNAPTPDRPFIYSEIVTHKTLDLMTKLIEYPSSAKKEAKREALRRNPGISVLRDTRTIAV